MMFQRINELFPEKSTKIRPIQVLDVKCAPFRCPRPLGTLDLSTRTTFQF